MNLKLLILFFLIFCLSLNSEAHKRAKFNIIIDSDGGQDDFRAITLFCASADFNINAITSVDGVLYPNESAGYFRKLIDAYGHQGILVASGRNYNHEKIYRDFAIKRWESLFETYENQKKSAIELMHESILREQKPTVIVALGPLTNISELLQKYPEDAKKIGLILWYNNVSDPANNFNYKCDTNAYNYLCSVKAPIKMISGNKEVAYTETFQKDIETLNNRYTKMWLQFHKDTQEHPAMVWDEISALYLTNPNTFTETYTSDGMPMLTPELPIIPEVQVLSILNINRSLGGVIYNEIPTKGNWLRADVIPFTDTLIQAHGYPEFKIVAMASEFHSHLGIYSIVGAKMGMRAMEYFHAGLDEISVTSYAGSTPPLSCLNDGLQFGTGATLGYGNIFVTDTALQAAASITYNGQTVHFALHESWQKRIANDIGTLVKQYGLESDAYWNALRQLSFKYWLEMDRFTMFIIH